MHTISRSNLRLRAEVRRLRTLVRVKVQRAVAEMAGSRGPKAQPGMRTEELPGVHRVPEADVCGSVICGAVMAEPGRVPREWIF